MTSQVVLTFDSCGFCGVSMDSKSRWLSSCIIVSNVSKVDAWDILDVLLDKINDLLCRFSGFSSFYVLSEYIFSEDDVLIKSIETFLGSSVNELFLAYLEFFDV